MFDLIVRGGRVIDPVSGVDGVRDIAVSDGKVCELAESLEICAAKEVIDASGQWVIPGIIDMHTHVRTHPGHPHAQRMLALAGVTTTLDMAGPLQQILDSIPTSGSGINVAVVEAAREGLTLTSARPDAAERQALLERTLEEGGIGLKLLGGHFPMDLDVAAGFIEEAARANAWIAWHAGNTVHGSDIEGMRDAVECADGRFLHCAHINSYCRGKIRNELDEAMEAVALLKAHPNVFSESYLSPLNGTRLNIVDDRPTSSVTASCLKKMGCTPDRAGMQQAIASSRAGVLIDDGMIGRLAWGEEALHHWLDRGTDVTGCFAVNPAVSRFYLAQAKRDDGTFAVDAFSTDGGSYPRNVIVENGLLLVEFGALTLKEFVWKASGAGARALGLASKGHLAVTADADITVIDPVRRRARATVVGGRTVMVDGVLKGSGTTIICDARGEAKLKKRGIACCVKAPLDAAEIARRTLPAG